MEMRPLTGSDALAFQQLRLQALEGEPMSFGESTAEHLTLSLETIAERLANPNSLVYGAFDDGLIGTVGFYREGREKTGHKGHVWGVYVDPAYRGKGVAKSLLAALLDRVRAFPGLEQVQLAVGKHQEPARRVYASLGF